MTYYIKKESNNQIKTTKAIKSVKKIYFTKMNDTRNMKKEKKQHIQVFVRVR